MANIIGRFYFKMTQNGNLIGEYSNSGMDGVDAEFANSISNDQGFIGKYNSVWEEDNNKTYTATLNITFKYPNNTKIFSLEWINKSGITVHSGEGMIVDDMLIGDYRNY
jgi:hypothetical protein